MEYVAIYAMMGIIRSEVIEAKFLHTIPCFKITISLKERSDSGLTRGPIGPCSWKPDIDHAPGCSVTYGYPANQSPFVQIHLPKGWKYEKNQAEQCHTVLIQVQSWHEGQTANKIKPLKWLVRGVGDGSANWRRKTNLCFRVQSLPPKKG